MEFALHNQYSLLTIVLFIYVFIVVWYGMVYSGRKLLVSLSHYIEINSTFELGEEDLTF